MRNKWNIISDALKSGSVQYITPVIQKWCQTVSFRNFKNCIPFSSSIIYWRCIWSLSVCNLYLDTFLFPS
jgi:hypothetical protein